MPSSDAQWSAHVTLGGGFNTPRSAFFARPISSDPKTAAGSSICIYLPGMYARRFSVSPLSRCPRTGYRRPYRLHWTGTRRACGCKRTGCTHARQVRRARQTWRRTRSRSFLPKPPPWAGGEDACPKVPRPRRRLKAARALCHRCLASAKKYDDAALSHRHGFFYPSGSKRFYVGSPGVCR